MTRRLLYLNGVAIIGAVLNHAVHWGFIALIWWSPRYRTVTGPGFDQIGSATYFGLRIVEQFITFVIPAFLFVSGFFIAVSAGRSQVSVPWSLVRARLRNLITPYLLWSLIILVGLVIQGRRFGLIQLTKLLAFGGVAAPFYYIPLLCQLYLLSPFLVPIARKRAPTLLLLAAALQLSTVSLSYFQIVGIESPLVSFLLPLTRGWFFITHLFWFTLGMVSGFHLTRIKAWAINIRWYLLVLAATLFVLGMAEWEFLLRWSGRAWLNPKVTVIDDFYSLCCLMTFVGFENVVLPGARWIDRLGTNSFGIYLVHAPVLELTARALYHLMPAVLAWQILFQPALFASGLVVPLSMMYLIQHSPARRYYQQIFG